MKPSPISGRFLRMTMFLTFAVLLAALTGCTGGGSSGGGLSGGVLSATIAGVNGAPDNVVNQSSASGVFMTLEVGSPAMATDTIVLTFVDPAGNTQSFETAAVDGGGMQAVGPIDLSMLEDGSVEVSARLRGANGVEGESSDLGLIDIDQTPPATPDLAMSPAANGVPVDIVSQGNEESVSLRIDLAEGFEAGVTLQVEFTSDGGSVTTPVFQPTPGATSIFSPEVNLAGLGDGPVSAVVALIDEVGNSTLYQGNELLKDTFVPDLQFASVPLSDDNPLNVVTAVTAPATRIDVELPAESQSGDMVRVVIEGAGGDVDLGQQAAPMGGGTLSFTGIDLSSEEDGPVSYRVEISDGLGNLGQLNGQATKDTLVGLAISGEVPASPENNLNGISAASSDEVFLDVLMNDDVESGDQILIVYTDINGQTTDFNAVAPADLSVPVRFGPVDTATLADGLITISTIIVDAVGNQSDPHICTATKDTVAPNPPIAVVVPMSASNPAGFVNLATTSSATLEGSLPEIYEVGSTVLITVSDGSNQQDLQAAAPSVGTAVTLPNVDLGAFVEGNLVLTIWVTDAVGNPSTPTMGSATKDVSVVGATAAGIPAGADNSAGFVTAASAAAATIELTMPAGAEADDIVNSTAMVGGSSTVLSAGNPTQGGGILSLTNQNLSSLGEGVLSISGTVTDVAGNVASFGPFSGFSIDTTAPAAPTNLTVAAGPGNSINEVNSTNEGATFFNITWPSGLAGNESLYIDLVSDGGGSLTLGPIIVSTVGGTVPIGPFDVSSLPDGNVSIIARIVDLAGNPGALTAPGFMKNASSVVAPSAAFVQGSLQNDQDVINSFNFNNTTVSVTLPSSYAGTESVSVILTDGMGVMVQSPAQTAAPGGGVLNFSAIDTTSQQDGPIILEVSVDPGSGPVLFTGSPATRDTVGPVAATSINVAATPDNPQDFVNGITEGAATVAVQIPADFDGTETIWVSVNDGSNPLVVSATQTNQIGPATVNFSGINLASLNDGTLSLFFHAEDANGNISKFNGTPALKDTVAPDMAGPVFVAPTMQNLQDVINADSVGAIEVSIDWPATLVGDETAGLILTSNGGGSISLTPTVPGGGGIVVLTGIDATALADGQISVVLTITDPAGNPTITNGVTATKDSTTSASATSVFVAAGTSNPQGFINSNNDTSTDVTVTFDVSADPVDTVRLELTDSMGGMIAPIATVNPAPGGSATFSGLDLSILADGLITIVVTVEDAIGNETMLTDSLTVKDVVAPTAPSMVRVPAGADNSEDFVTAATAAGATAEAMIPGDYAGDETIVFRFGQAGSSDVDSTGITATAGMVNTATGIDLLAFTDGALTLLVIVTDPAGNEVTVMGDTATKDTVVPIVNPSLSIDGGPNNDPEVVNLASVGSSTFTLTWDASLQGNEQASFIVTSAGGGSITVGPVTPPMNGGPDNVGPFNLGGLGDGALTITIEITDPAGNKGTAMVSTAVYDITPPDAPIAAEVAMGAGNAADVINISNDGAVNVNVTFSNPADVTDVYEVRLSDGSMNSATSAGTLNPPASGGLVSLSGFDTSAFDQGNVDLVVTVTDVARNTTVFNGDTALRDTVAPAAPTAAIPMTASNSADWISLASAGSVEVQVGTPAGYDGAETISVQLGDGTSMTTETATQSPAGGTPDTLSFSGIDAALLNDGLSNVAIIIRVVDGAGNSMVFAGTAASKDVVVPDDPTALLVVAGAQNGQDIVNEFNVNSVTTMITWGSAQDPAEVATLTATSSGGGTAATSATFNPSASGASDSVTGFDVSSLNDGTMTMTVNVSDPAGNAGVFQVNTIVLDVTAPDAPTAANVAAGANNPEDGINPNNVGSVTVSLTIPATSESTDTISLLLTDGTNSTLATPTQSPTGGVSQTLTFTGIDATGLNSGLVDIVVTLVDQYGNDRIFNGTQASLMLAPPATVTGANIASIMGTNPINWINAASAASFSVDVQTPASYDGTEQVSITVSDGVNSVSSAASLTAPVGVGTVTFTGLDAVAAGIMDSLSLTINVTVADTAGNSAVYGPFMGMKDVVDPDVPTALNVKAAAGVNLVDIIDSDNEAATILEVVWGASQATTDSATVLVGGSLTTTALAPSGAGATDSFSPLDTSSLSDGSVGLFLTVADEAGNTATFAGTNATKDSTAPDAPTAAFVTANLPQHGQNIINDTNEAAVEVQVNLPGASDAADTVSVSLIDTAMTSVSTGTLNGGVAMLTFSTLDVSSGGAGFLDGNVTISVTMTDEHGNTMDYTVNPPALMDTTDPASATAAIVPNGTNNPVGFINDMTKGSADVDVTTPASYTGVETVTVVLSDGSNMTAPEALTTSSGGGVLSFTGIDASGLNEGSIQILVDVVDGAQNSGTQFVGSATKDTIGPDLVSAQSNLDLGNAVNVIGPGNAAAVTLRASFGANSLATESFVIAVDDGSTTVNIPSISSPAGAGNIDQANQDLSSLEDGELTMTVTATDPAENEAVVTETLQKYAKLDVARVILAANRDDDTVTSYLFDTMSGVLYPTGFRVVGDAPVDMDIAQSAGLLFVANRDSDDITVMSVNRQEALLIEAASSPFAAGDAPVALAVDRSASVLAVANSTDNDIEMFTVDSSTGAIVSVATTALGGAPADVEMDPGARFVFATTPGMIHSFVLDRSTGVLSGANSQVFAAGTLRLEVHPSGQWLYVISESGNTIDTFDIDAATGIPTQKSQIATGTSPVSIELTPDGATAFVTNQGSHDASMYDVNPSTGVLTATAASPVSVGSVASAPSGAIADFDSNWLITTNRDDNDLQVLDVDTGAGTATSNSNWPTHTAPSDIVMLHAEGPAGVSFNLENVYVANQASGDVSQFTLNDVDGSFSALATELVASGSGSSSQPSGMVMHPSGEFFFVVNEAEDTVSRFAIGQVTGAATLLGSTAIPTNALGSPPRNPGGISMSPTGAFLFVTSTSTGEVVPFGINQVNGDLTAGTPVSTSGNDPTKSAVSTSGKFLYALNAGSAQVEAFSIDLVTGALASIDTESSLNTAENLTVHPSGRFLYVVTQFFGVKIFDIDSGSGVLAYKSGLDATTGAGANAIAVSPTGSFAYVVNKNDSNVSSFTVNAATGALTPAGMASTAPVDNDARNITVDPLGRYAYVTDFAQSGAGKVFIFDINPSTGVLTPNATQASQQLAGLGSDTIVMRFVVE